MAEKRENLSKVFKKAKLLAWITIGYLVFDATILFLTMQSSQAMKASWIEDILYFIPSISFLISAHFASRPPNKKFRFGYDRAYSIGFIISSIALISIGLYLFIESFLKLIHHEIVTIGTIHIFGETIWFGWIMILAVGYSIIPVYLIGQKKLKLAKKLNIQILSTDAKGQKADWLTSVATIIGIIGLGLGFWWADAIAAIIISLDIISDGIKSLKASLTEAMDRTPLDADFKKEDPLIEDIEEIVQQESWVEDYLVRLRTAGNKTTGEILVVTNTTPQVEEKMIKLNEKVENFSWKITEIVVAPVKKLPILFEKRL